MLNYINIILIKIFGGRNFCETKIDSFRKKALFFEKNPQKTAVLNTIIVMHTKVKQALRNLFSTTQTI